MAHARDMTGTPYTVNGGSAMPFVGNDWLALTQEPTLEPELPICDPHHHFGYFPYPQLDSGDPNTGK